MPFKHKLARRLAINDRQPARPRPWVPAAMALALGCTGVPVTDPAVSPIVSIALTPTNPTVFLGDSIEFQVVGITVAGDTQAVGMPIEWTASAGAITAKGNGKGQYKPRGGGRFRVTAQVDTLADSTIVTVVDTVPASVEVAPASVSLRLGATTNLIATVLDASGNPIDGRPLVWSTSNPAVATVSTSGAVTALDTGYATITAVSDGKSGAAALEVTALPAGTLLAVNWGTATGNSVAAVGDGGKGIMRWCSWDQVLNVVPGSGVGWTRTANVLSIRSINNCGHVEFPNLFPLPTDGQQQYWVVRYYVMNGVGQTDTKMHPHCFWPVGLIEGVHTQIFHNNGQFTNGDWEHGFVIGNGAGLPVGHWRPITVSNTPRRLTAGTWYRYEFIMHWVSATQFRVYPRLYDMNGTLLNDYTTWEYTDIRTTLEAWYNAGNYFTRRPDAGAPDNIRDFSFGMGQAGSSSQYYYVADAAFALGTSINDFIGQ